VALKSVDRKVLENHVEREEVKCKYTHIDAISAIDTTAAKNPTKLPIYIQINPPVPPLISPKIFDVCANQLPLPFHTYSKTTHQLRLPRRH